MHAEDAGGISDGSRCVAVQATTGHDVANRSMPEASQPEGVVCDASGIGIVTAFIARWSLGDAPATFCHASGVRANLAGISHTQRRIADTLCLKGVPLTRRGACPERSRRAPPSPRKRGEGQQERP